MDEAPPKAPQQGPWGGGAIPEAGDPAGPSLAPNPDGAAGPGPDAADGTKGHWGGLRRASWPGLTLWRAWIVMLVWGVVTLMGGVVLIDVPTPGPLVFDKVLVLNIALAGGIVLAAGLVMGQAGGWFRAPLPGSLGRLWLALLYLALLAVLVLAMGLPPPGALALLAVNCLLIGLSEEMMFRGLFYSALRSRRGIMGAVVLSSLVFGAVHVLNATLTGDLTAAAIQAVFAAFLGLALAGMRLITGSLVWPVVFHALWDLGVMSLARARDLAEPRLTRLDPAALEMAAPILFILPLALLSLWQIHRLARRPEALARA